MTSTNETATPRSGRTIEQLADRLGETVRSVTGVADLYAGPLGEVGTYLPGRRVPGIRLREEALTSTGSAERPPVEIHVVIDAGAPVLQTAQAVHVAAESYLASAGLHPTVLVHVADIADKQVLPST